MKAIGSICNINAGAFIIFKQRNKIELECILGEVSNYYDKTTLLEMYEIATKDPFSFLYINLSASKRSDVCWLRFEYGLVPTAAAPASNAILQ